MVKTILIKSCMLLFLLLLVVSAGCRESRGDEKSKGVHKEKDKVLNVKVAPVTIKSLRPFIKANGNLAASDEVIVSSEIDGILNRVAVDEGSSVTGGMLMASIRDSDYRLQVQQAKAMLKQAGATIRNARTDFGRKEALHKEELLTNQQLDDASTRLSLAEADVEGAKANLDLAVDRLGKTSIYAPLEGVIKEKKISSGSYVKSGTPLFTIISIDPLKLFFPVTEKDIGRIKKGQEVSFTVDSFPGRTFSGKVRTIYPNLDEATRTLKVDAEVPNGESTLKPGLFANVTLYTGDPVDTILIPLSSVEYDDDRTKVFVMDGDVVREREVTLGAQYGDFMAVVKGVGEKDSVVTAGQQNLAEGVKVHVDR